MESLQFNNESIKRKIPFHTDIKDYCPKQDWKFQTVVFMGNNFSSTLNIDLFSAVDLELSLKNPKLDALCLNILYKLLMKKAFFKPNSKINDWQSKEKLQQLLVKKLVYFYKIYARSISQKHHMPFSKEALEKELNDDSFFSNDRFDIKKKESYYKEKELENDLKKLMIVELFNSLNGKNPLLSKEYYEIFPQVKNQEKNSINANEDMNIEEHLNSNKIVIDTNDIISNTINKDNKDNTSKLNEDDDEDNYSSLSKDEEQNNNTINSKSKLNRKKKTLDSNCSSDIEDNESKYSMQEMQETVKNEIYNNGNNQIFTIIDTNIKEEDYSHLLNFEEFTLKEKVEVLYFFFLYCIEFSGRQHIFKQEALENDALNKIVNSSHKENISISNDCNKIIIMKSAIKSLLANPNDNDISKAFLKQNKILGFDNEDNIYSIPLVNKNCLIVKDNNSTLDIETLCSSYTEVENFLELLEKQKQEVNNELAISVLNSSKAKNNKSRKPQISVHDSLRKKEKRLIDLCTNIKDFLLTFKEFEEETKKKENNYLKKSMIASKNESQGKEYVLMNMTDHITTRRQLNKLAQEAIPVFGNNESHLAVNTKTKESIYEEQKRIRIEQQTLDRERRMQERNKLLQEGAMLGRKRESHGYRSKGRVNYEENSEDDDFYNEVQEEKYNRENRRIRIKTTNSSNSNTDDKYSEYQYNEESESVDNDEEKVQQGRRRPERVTYNHNKGRRDIVNKKKNNYSSGFFANRNNNKNENISEKEDEREEEVHEVDEGGEIMMECSLIIRYPLNQLEIIGKWGMSTETLNEKMSYLFNKSTEKQRIFINKNEVLYGENVEINNNNNSNANTSNENYITTNNTIANNDNNQENDKPNDENEAKDTNFLNVLNNNFISSKNHETHIDRENIDENNHILSLNNITTRIDNNYINQMQHIQQIDSNSNDEDKDLLHISDNKFSKEITNILENNNNKNINITIAEESSNNNFSNTLYHNNSNNNNINRNELIPTFNNIDNAYINNTNDISNIINSNINNITYDVNNNNNKETKQIHNNNTYKKKTDILFFTSKDLENYEPIDICINNLHELLLINNNQIFSEVLKFLSAEYSGYFIYFSKTVEDRFTLNLIEQNSSLVEIDGEGINSLGKFKIKGYVNFFRDRFDLLRNNSMEDDFIRIAKIKMTRHYLVFNPNENERVIKSFTHRKRKKDDNGDIIYGLTYQTKSNSLNPNNDDNQNNNIELNEDMEDNDYGYDEMEEGIY